VDPREPIHDQPPETLLTLRSVTPGNGYDGPFWFDRYRGPPRVFFGHTVLEDPLVGRTRLDSTPAASTAASSQPTISVRTLS
jgi:hypothetical protein